MSWEEGHHRRSWRGMPLRRGPRRRGVQTWRVARVAAARRRPTLPTPTWPTELARVLVLVSSRRPSRTTSSSMPYPHPRPSTLAAHTTGGPSTNGPAAAVANDAAADSDGGGDLGEGEVCWICVSGPRDAVLLECGHGGICYSCAERCARKRPPLCPMCRQRISCVVRLDDGPEERIDGQVVVKVQA